MPEVPSFLLLPSSAAEDFQGPGDMVAFLRGNGQQSVGGTAAAGAPAAAPMSPGTLAVAAAAATETAEDHAGVAAGPSHCK
jgi:hypothetical protein